MSLTHSLGSYILDTFLPICATLTVACRFGSKAEWSDSPSTCPLSISTPDQRAARSGLRWALRAVRFPTEMWGQTLLFSQFADKSACSCVCCLSKCFVCSLSIWYRRTQSWRTSTRTRRCPNPTTGELHLPVFLPVATVLLPKWNRSVCVYRGGYIVKPFLMEFWQGQTTRLHDRIVFTKTQDGDPELGEFQHPAEAGWSYQRLAPWRQGPGYSLTGRSHVGCLGSGIKCLSKTTVI